MIDSYNDTTHSYELSKEMLSSRILCLLFSPDLFKPVKICVFDEIEWICLFRLESIAKLNTKEH